MGHFGAEHSSLCECSTCDRHKRVEALARHRKAKRISGYCGWDGCNEVAGVTYYCENHRERERARQQARRDAAKEQGVSP